MLEARLGPKHRARARDGFSPLLASSHGMSPSPPSRSPLTPATTPTAEHRSMPSTGSARRLVLPRGSGPSSHWWQCRPTIKRRPPPVPSRWVAVLPAKADLLHTEIRAPLSMRQRRARPSPSKAGQPPVLLSDSHDDP
ncbi:hypothetical protein Dimus_026300 [Dionaea muscipula]